MTEKINLPPIKLGSPGEEISKRDLHAISQRFKNLHTLRQQRIQEFLLPRQRVFLDLLPLLFHINHSLLPGYVAANTPYGIPEYQPSRTTLNAAKIFSNSFKYKKRALKTYLIKGLFLMGSVSSIAFSKSSDMDIWLCHESGLTAEDLHTLQQKATAIEQWADTFNLEVHFFLIDSEQFRHGQCTPISSESSGNTQHFLLLEEFYRTSIYIAGCCPAWWLVPPHEEQNYSQYVNHLKQKRFISELEIIDFGGLEKVPAGEFISATLWHIYKSIASPHKSLLKLLLMECYASEFPQPQWLSLILKQAIYKGSFHIDEVDPYLLIYQKVDRYLKNAQDVERIELARHCFYLKILGTEASNVSKQLNKPRLDFLSQVAKQYSWPEATLREFSRRKTWDITKAVQEHQTILLELIHSYRATKGFASQYEEKNALQNADMKLIGRKLFSFLEKKPGKIEIIATRSNIFVKDKELSILDTAFASDTSGFALYHGKLLQKKPRQQAIKTSGNLFELLTWLVVNKLYHAKLKLHLSSPAFHFVESELALYLSIIDDFLSNTLKTQASDLNIYRQANKIVSSIVFVNAGFPMSDAREDGLLLISDRSDSLSYGHERTNFVQSIERISISTWGEVTVAREQGIEGLFNCFTDIFNNSSKAVKSADLTVICQTLHRAKSISKRIQDIFVTLIKLYSQPDQTLPTRYILVGGKSFYIFQLNNGQLQYWDVGTEQALFDELSTPVHFPGGVHFDREVLGNTPIPAIYSQNIFNVVQVFYYVSKDSIDVFILDEKATLFQQTFTQCKADQLLSAYALFFEAILNRDLLDFSLTLKYYEIQQNSAGNLTFIPVKATTRSHAEHLNVRVTGKLNSKNKIQYYIYCNEQEFASIIYGDKLFKTVADYVLKLRSQNEKYPIYISDIDVPYNLLGANAAPEVQTSHYLKFKQKFEARLNSL